MKSFSEFMGCKHWLSRSARFGSVRLEQIAVISPESLQEYLIRGSKAPFKWGIDDDGMLCLKERSLPPLDPDDPKSKYTAPLDLGGADDLAAINMNGSWAVSRHML